MKLAAFLAAHALATPQREAVACGEVRLSFYEIDDQSTRLANGLVSRGIALGDRVAIYLSNRAEFVVAFMGIVKAGAIAITLNPRLSAPEVAYILADATPRAIILESETRAVLARTGSAPAIRISVDEPCALGEVAFSSLAKNSGTGLPDIPPEFDDCMISYTSGTTGKPKGAIITQGNYIMLAAYLNGLQWQLTAKDRILATTPLAHRSAFQRLLNMVCAGAVSWSCRASIPRKPRASSKTKASR